MDKTNKRCAKFRNERDISLFCKSCESSDGHGSYCKDCLKDVNAAYRKNNAERVAKMKRDWRLRNMEKSRASSRRSVAKRRADPVKTQQSFNYWASWKRKKNYGIDDATFLSMLELQRYLCKICGKPETGKHQSGKVKQLHIDHDHKTGVIRGLLCCSCNRGLGFFQDDPGFLRAAADYIDSHKAATSTPAIASA